MRTDADSCGQLKKRRLSAPTNDVTACQTDICADEVGDADNADNCAPPTSEKRGFPAKTPSRGVASARWRAVPSRSCVSDFKTRSRPGNAELSKTRDIEPESPERALRPERLWSHRWHAAPCGSAMRRVLPTNGARVPVKRPLLLLMAKAPRAPPSLRFHPVGVNRWTVDRPPRAAPVGCGI